MLRHDRAAEAPVPRGVAPPRVSALADLERHHDLELQRLAASGAVEGVRARMEHQIRERHRREREAFLRRLDR